MKRVYIAGSWDLFHLGHVKFLEVAHGIALKNKAKLIVGINTDKLYRKYKRKEPVIPFKYRKKMLGLLKWIDEIVPVNVFNPLSMVKRYKIDIYLTSKEWEDGEQHIKRYMEGKGGKAIFLPYFKGISATEIRDKIVQNYAKKQLKYCAECHKRL